jgi:hypothetical protein
MREDERARMESEKAELVKLIAMLPSTARLDRRSLQGRLTRIEAALQSAGPAGHPIGRARLTFSGRPVIESHGIFAEFGLDATRTFAEGVIALAAARVGPLAPRGPIPNRDRNQLLITSVAHGSFGFELEEFVPPGDHPLSETPLNQALGQAQDLLEGTTASDEDLAEAVWGTDDRALGTFRTFLEKLEANDATCGLETRGRKFQFSDVSQVRGALDRIRPEMVREETLDREVKLLGVLPTRRRFEMELEPGNVISGKIGEQMGDLTAISLRAQDRVRVRLLVRSVGAARPRYTLLGIGE